MTEDQIRETLKQVYDPEIGVNIVDLGLVYNIEIKPEEVTNMELRKILGLETEF